MNDYRYHVIKIVKQLQPGEEIAVDPAACPVFCPMNLAGYSGEWRYGDWILEGVVGSAYEYYWHANIVSGLIIFGRLPQPLNDGRRSYVSPDRVHYFSKEGRFYYPRSSVLSS